MDFRPIERMEATRREFRTWLEANSSPAHSWPRLRREGTLAERVEFLRAWQRRLFEAGWIALHFPREYGGGGRSLLEHLAVQEELARAEAPPLINGAAISIFAPTLWVFGSEEQKRRFLPRLFAAEELWCLGFSEPNAGSDLASLRTRAEPVEGGWAISGQKVWTTYAHHADFGLFLVRTDPEAESHRGISCFLVPMHAPGITVRPLRDMTGDCEFNEVFLDRVVVPHANLVGELHRGWQVILTALGHERGTLLLVDQVRRRVDLERLRRQLRANGLWRDPLLRDRFAQHYVETAITGLHGLRLLADLEQGRTAADVSVLKLFGSEMAQRLADFALAVQGPYAQSFAGEPRAPQDGAWQHFWLMARAMTIASGTSEIQRNIIAQRLLGLPRS